MTDDEISEIVEIILDDPFYFKIHWTKEEMQRIADELPKDFCCTVTDYIEIEHKNDDLTDLELRGWAESILEAEPFSIYAETLPPYSCSHEEVFWWKLAKWIKEKVDKQA